MAKIPLILNPEAPKGNQTQIVEPRTAKFTMPETRYQAPADSFTKHIPGLMQRELSERPFQARAAAQAGIGRELQGLAGDIGEFAHDMAQAKDAAAESFAKINQDTVLSAYEEEVAKAAAPVEAGGKGKPIGAMERMALWQEKYEPQLDQYLEGLQPSANVRGELLAKSNNFKARARTGIWDAINKEQIEEIQAIFQADFDSRLQEGDYDGAGGVVVRAVEARAITKGQGHQMLAKIKDHRLESDLAKSDPEAGLQELDEAENLPEGSDVFGKLNAVTIKEYRKKFHNQINDRVTGTYKELDEAQAAGTIKSREDVINIANGRLNRQQLQGYWNGVEIEPTLDEGKFVALRGDIRNYRKDKDTETLTQFDSLLFRIQTEVPTHLQGPLKADLHNEYQRSRENKPTPRATQLTGESDKFLTDAGELGYFDPPTGYDSKALAGMKPEEREQYNRENWTGYGEKWKRIHEAQDEIAEFIKNKPDATRTDILKEINALVDPEKRDKIQKETNYRAFQSARDLGIIPRRAGAGGAGTSVPPSAKEVREGLKSSTTPGYGMKTSMRETREEIMSELDRDPKTKTLAMQMLDTEGGGVATMEALVNRTAMIREKVPGWTLWDELNSGFYGPIKRGVAQSRRLGAGAISRYEQDIQTVRAGSNVIQGRTDQGYAGDPNASGPGRVLVKSNPKEVYNYWTGKRGSAQFSHADAAAFARRMMRVEKET